MNKIEYRIASYNGNYVIFAVIISPEKKVLGISKHPTGPRTWNDKDKLIQELELYTLAKNEPVLDNNNFNYWDYFMINGWEDFGSQTEEEWQEFIDNFVKQNQ